MITFNYELDFSLENEEQIQNWILKVISSFGKKAGDINYIFCDDEYLHKVNVEYLDHDDLTDIISFDYSNNKKISGDIFISVDRVRDNSNSLNNNFIDELHRVIIHGVLHYIGYKDKKPEEAEEMRKQEDYCLSLWV